MKSALEPVNSGSDPANLLDLDRAGMEAFFIAMGEKRFRATQLFKWVHQHRVSEFEQMLNFSKPLRAALEKTSEIRTPEIVHEQHSADGTIKWVLQTHCGNRIETVFIPEAERGTLCISSQVGCVLDCSFCSTAQQGFNRNLSVSEIIGQLWVALERLGDRGVVSNVVMMGMGEPLLNFSNVVASINIMMDDCGYGLSKRRVTLSTSGVVPAIYRLKEHIDIALAVSLHAPDNNLRDQLVPINKKYPLEELMAACRAYVSDVHRKKVTMEYVMLDGINDSPSQARGLCRLLSDVPSKINLIPFNPFPGTRFRCSRADRIRRFGDILMEAGFVTTTRKTRGDDIDAACGQLVGKVEDRTRRTQSVVAGR